MANSSQSLPNPFQNETISQIPTFVAPTTINSAKTVQNDTSLFHGYRSHFDINQQKQMYQQRMEERVQTERVQQRGKFNWHNHNSQNQFNRIDRNNANDNNKGNHSFGPDSGNWCELCECGFKYPKQLEKHQDEHEKCWFDNCNFEGHSKLLKKHIEVQHQSGLFKKIGKVESEEDILKWREERRKRYPTKENIEARRMAQEERMKRGERIQEPNNRFGNINNRKSAQHRSFGQRQSNSDENTESKNDSPKNQRNNRNDRKRRRTRNPNKFNKGDHDKNANKKDDKLNDEKKTEIVSGEHVENCDMQSIPSEKPVQNANALTALIGMYGSDSESDANQDDESQPDEKDAGPVAVTIEKCGEVPVLESTEMIEANELVTSRKRSASIETEQQTKQLKIELETQNEVDAQQAGTLDSEKIEENPILVENQQIESDDETPEEQPIQRKSDGIEQSIEANSGPTEVKTMEKPKKYTNEKMTKKRHVLDMTRKIRNQNTLLEKLLQKDIRHERNILLQCVRYVVENNFFGIGQKSNEQNNQTESSSNE